MPPFPGPTGPVVVDTGPSGGPPETDAEIDAAIDAIRAARVGGEFWAPGDRDPWSVAGSVQGEPDDPAVLVGWLLARPVADRDGRPHARATMRAALTAAIGGRAWRDPFFGRPATLLDTIALLGGWRASIDANRRIGAAVGFASWKQKVVARFLWDGATAPAFQTPARGIAAASTTGRTVACWPSRVPARMEADARARGVAVAWVEDGFLRSNGLGADCRPPASVAVDFSGIHYDPERPSDLETLLATHPFPPDLLARAGALRARIVAARIGKYGVGTGPVTAVPTGRRIVLAIGQVGDDLSVVRAGAGLGGGGPFLERVRAAEPGAHIVYRPHPDVLAGHRRGHVALAETRRWADQIDEGGDLLALVERADAVHVLSSLTGFEALMRGREVVVHGRPFYSGWGLTRDLAAQPERRGRELCLDALVAGALILYPRYLDPVTTLPCPPEVLVERIAAGSAAGGSWMSRLRQAQGRVRRRLTLLREATR